MSRQNPNDEPEPKLGKTLLDDVRQGGFFHTIRRDYRELKEFFLTPKRKARLANMGIIKRTLFTAWWLLKALFFKLTPARRLLLVSSLLAFFWQPRDSDQNDYAILALFLLLFVLMLELKDKLLAHDELRAGRSVQVALMPKRQPEVPGWELWLFTRPANEVGGDLVDFQQIDDQRYGVAVADIAGKGLQAALLMAKLQATLRALAPDFYSLAALGTKINSIFYRDRIATSFASLVYLEFTPTSGAMRAINAGHLPPLVLRKHGIEEMPVGDLALGLSANASYKEHVLDLATGESILLYSDGLNEAQNEAGSFFGEQRLKTLLTDLSHRSAREIGETLVSAVNHFIGEARRSDDLSIAVLRRNG